MKVEGATLTVSAVRSKRVAVRAYAPEGSGDVVASESTLISQLLAFVHVFANLKRINTKPPHSNIGERKYLHRPGCEPFVAGALEAPYYVGASAVAANVRGAQALVVVHTLHPGGIQHVTHGAFAAEGSVRVHTITTFTHVRHHFALVQVIAGVSTTRPFRTEFQEFSWNERTH